MSDSSLPNPDAQPPVSHPSSSRGYSLVAVLVLYTVLTILLLAFGIRPIKDDAASAVSIANEAKKASEADKKALQARIANLEKDLAKIRELTLLTNTALNDLHLEADSTNDTIAALEQRIATLDSRSRKAEVSEDRAIPSGALVGPTHPDLSPESPAASQVIRVQRVEGDGYTFTVELSEARYSAGAVRIVLRILSDKDMSLFVSKNTRFFDQNGREKPIDDCILAGELTTGLHSRSSQGASKLIVGSVQTEVVLIFKKVSDDVSDLSLLVLQLKNRTLEFRGVPVVR